MKIKTFRKKIFLLLAITALVSMAVLPSVFAQDYTDISVSLQVDQGQFAEISMDGCWKYVITPNWLFTGTSLSLLQPGDRGDGTETGDPADGEDSDWGTVTGTAKYDTEGGDANGNVVPTDTNAFAYGDCKFTLTMQGYTEYDVQLYGTQFLHNTNLVDEILDMHGSGTAGFDYILDSDDPPYDYFADQGEHGFYVVAEDIGNIKNDSGAAGGTDYTAKRAYNAINCPAGTGTRPCYHMIPSSGSPQILYDEASTNFTDKTIIIREGLSADFNSPAGGYTMTLTVNVYTNP